VILTGDIRTVDLPVERFRTCVTSPPYWQLRDYGVGVGQQIGLDETLDEYVAELVGVFRRVRQALTEDGTLWLNLGDSYASNRSYQVTDTKHVDVGNSRGMTVPDGLKPKDLVGIPWRVAFALQQDGWYLRSDIIWAKRNPMPESVMDRPTRAHEYVFLLSKAERYFYDQEAIAEQAVGAVAGNSFERSERISGGLGAGSSERWDPGNRAIRNRRDVWTILTEPFPEAHFAVMPTRLAELCVLAGSERGDFVLDPFCGAGTTGLVALRHGREFLGVELNPAFVALANRRLAEVEVAML